MNFIYSGQIIALANYFDKRQSVATSLSMTGIGVGMFFMVSHQRARNPSGHCNIDMIKTLKVQNRIGMRS